MLLILALFGAFSVITGGGGYYGGKLVAGAYLVFVPMLGTYGWLKWHRAPRLGAAPARRERPAVEPASRRAHRPLAGARSFAVPVAVLVALGGAAFVQQRLPSVTDGIKASGTGIPLFKWADGGDRSGSGALDEYLAQVGLVPAPRPTIVVPSSSRSQTWGATLFVAALSGRMGQMDRPLYWLNSLNNLKAAPQADVGSVNQALATSVRLAAAASPSPPDIFVYDQGVAQEISAALQSAPLVPATVTVDLQLTVAGR